MQYLYTVSWTGKEPRTLHDGHVLKNSTEDVTVHDRKTALELVDALEKLGYLVSMHTVRTH